jgi:hypothetical protein
VPPSKKRLIWLVLVCVAAVFARVTIWIDVIEMSSMRGTDLATVVSTGRRGGCDPYVVSVGSPTQWVANYGSATGCPSELAVFAAANAMRLQSTAAVWTNQPFDVASVAMQDPYVVPLNVFVLSGDALNYDVNVRIARAKDDVAAAKQLWDGNQCGITYAPTYIDASHSNNITHDLLTASCGVGDYLSQFKAVDPRTAVKGLNVFYIDGDPGVQGEHCLDGSSAVILITLWSGNDTLAHEIGHVLSLQHTNDPVTGLTTIAGMPNDDLMNSPSPYPAELTVGQCFRANVNDVSRLNTLPIRTEPTRSCPDNVTNISCPALTTHK